MDGRLRILRVSTRLLLEALHLPEDTEILDVHSDIERRDVLTFKVTHPSFDEVPIGAQIPLVIARLSVVRGDDPDVITVTWRPL